MSDMENIILLTLYKHGLITKCAMCSKWVLAGNSFCDDCDNKAAADALDSISDTYGGGE